MANLGIMEIFFGPPWEKEDRLAYASFLKNAGYGFYIYGPKADKWLRKSWNQPYPESFLSDLKELSRTYRAEGLKFGLAFSPFGTQEKLDAKAESDLKRSVGILSDAGLDIFGLFFDDMPGSDGLAERQLKVIDLVARETNARLVFCPSYYSPDPILDKVFGQRPAGYLDELGRHTPENVDILWTGPKVISADLPAAHLEETARVLRRKPFLCDNLYANDGPKNCKFLKLRPCEGRPPEALALTSGWALNPMNQSEVSKIVLLSSVWAMTGKYSPEESLENAVARLCPPELKTFLLENREAFFKGGLDTFSPDQSAKWQQQLEIMQHPLAREISLWLQGKFTVGSECLTD